jgi:hypothetical protein
MQFCKSNIYLRIIVFLITFLFSTNLKATHLKAGEFSAVRSVSDPLTYTITLNLYLEEGPVTQNEVDIKFGDGVEQKNISFQSSTFIGNNTRHNIFIVTHTFPSAGFYKISVDHQFRNFEILNMPNPGQTDFYLELGLLINPFLGLNQTPLMTIPPIDIGAINKIYKHNPGAYDPDGDSISFKLITSQTGPNQPVIGYVYPNDPKFGGQSTNGGNATLTLNEQTGDLIWNTPSGFGSEPRYYNIAIMVEEWRAGIRLSYVIRDMQILIEPTTNNPPIVTIPKDTCIEAGTNYVSSFFARDPDGDNVELKAYGAPFAYGASVVFSGQNSVFPSGVFTWPTNCTHVRNQPYDVVVQATDILNIPKLVDYQTWRLTIKGPRVANVLTTPSGSNQMKLDWDAYPCSNAATIEIYRSECVGITPPINGCNTNLPAGYIKIAEIPATNVSYLDNDNGKGLKSGLTYCYILIVKYQYPAYGVSYPSDPACNSLSSSNPLPIKLEVTNTDKIAGSIFLNWLKPAALSAPVTYEIERTSLTALNSFTTIQVTTDTFFVDNNLNTIDSLYTYRVKVQNTSYASAPVQQMNVTAVGGNSKVDLSWSYTIPWNPDSIEIYRSVNKSPYIKITTTSSTVLKYTDTGVLNCDTVDYYLIQYGKYCDFSIKDTTQLISGINRAYPVDDSPLPPPKLNVEGCNGDLTVFKNTLNWSNLTLPVCNRLLNYRLYYAEHTNESFTLLKELTDTFYVDIDSLSTAGCYYVVGVNTKGVEGNISNIVCVDDCIYYQLPNLITVNSDLKNDVFEPYPVPRGVKFVTLSVYNIWGELVYFEEQATKLSWNGKNNKGAVAPGVYYYEAVVNYNRRVNKSDEKQIIKSWLHILRDE